MLDFFRSASVDGIQVPQGVLEDPDVTHNYSYFPIVVEPREGLDRDVLYKKLRSRGVIARKYYYPTVLDLPIYDALNTRVEEVSNAAFLSKSVLCLPVNSHFDNATLDVMLRQIDACLAEVERYRSA